jgi:hypothetical protein
LSWTGTGQRWFYLPLLLPSRFVVASVTTLERVDTRQAANNAPPSTTGLARPHPPLDRAPSEPIQKER